MKDTIQGWYKLQEILSNNMHNIKTLLSALSKIGIQNKENYKRGDWIGNSSLDGMRIFESVTYNLSELLNSIRIAHHGRVKVTFDKDNFTLMEPKQIGSKKYGRCYHLLLQNKKSSIINSVEMTFKRDMIVYFDIPFMFHINLKSNARINVNASQKIMLPVTYEIIKTNFDEKCRTYDSTSYIGSFDECKVAAMEERLQTKFNCTVPFLMQSGPLCVGKAAKDASSFYDTDLKHVRHQCPRPCHRMITTFGLPRYYSPGKQGGEIRLYFNSLVKVTEDFVSYDLLRSVSRLIEVKIIFFCFSACWGRVSIVSQESRVL